MKKLLLFYSFFAINVLNAGCVPCSLDPLEQIYPNQNQCVLLAQIPAELQNLPYGMYPNCDNYNTSRFGYNKRFNIFPHAIFVPTTSSQVVFLLQTFKKYKLPFTVRSGGHCYGPGSLSSGYIIDLRNFNSIIPDINTQTVFIGSGNRLGTVIEALGALNFAIPTGSCPSVGVAGLALGGGIGLLARQYGLTSDSLISMTVVLADTSIVEVSAQNYPDLFWALSGAGAHSFGIVLGFTFKMHYIPEVSYAKLSWHLKDAQVQAIFNTWQSWITTLPTTITSELNFRYQNGISQIVIAALKTGSEPLTELFSTFNKFNPTVVNNYHGTYLGAADLFASTYTLPFSKVKSKFLFKPLAGAGIQATAQFFTMLEQTQCEYIVLFEFGSAVGGAISSGNSAYFPRNALIWLFQFIYWQREQQSTAAINTINQIYTKLEPYTSVFSYANLVDFELGQKYLYAYYGSHISRLIAIKNKYDPANIFTWRQGIPTKLVPRSEIAYRAQLKYGQC
jgi:hypothetical protein